MMVKEGYRVWMAILGLYLGAVIPLYAQMTESSESKKEALWKKIAPYFSPPQGFQDKQDMLRPLTVFYNGDTLHTAKDWPKRQLEIKKRWDSLMGNWPTLLQRQKLSIIDTKEKESHFEYQVKFYWTPTEETTGYLLVPKTKGKKPAVITVFYEPETAIGKGKPNRDFALQLTKRGFVTLSIGTTAASERKEFSLFYPSIEDAQVQPLSMLAYAAANAYYALAKFPEVLPDKIGIMGHSFGGKWAMFASCLFDRFACAVWSDPGILFQHDRESINYWEPWYLGYHPKPWRKRGLITADNPAYGLYPELVKNGYNLHELHALMAPRPFLVLGGAEDPPARWHALNRIVTIDKMLGYDNRVAMHNRPTHEPNNEANEIAYSFFEYFLK
ncbi:sialidase [Olivibacter sp. CPCC 100613]|uniref:sialidase n=1 Tax=Olivibacter sp. CPCC 100613 TaxID=3079931 RepID=UPI002FFA838B